jgi:hypothetical protein
MHDSITDRNVAARFGSSHSVRPSDQRFQVQLGVLAEKYTQRDLVNEHGKPRIV